jgi:hypothetical protein
MFDVVRTLQIDPVMMSARGQRTNPLAREYAARAIARAVTQ